MIAQLECAQGQTVGGAFECVGKTDNSWKVRTSTALASKALIKARSTVSTSCSRPTMRSAAAKKSGGLRSRPQASHGLPLRTWSPTPARRRARARRAPGRVDQAVGRHGAGQVFHQERGFLEAVAASSAACMMAVDVRRRRPPRQRADARHESIAFLLPARARRAVRSRRAAAPASPQRSKPPVPRSPDRKHARRGSANGEQTRVREMQATRQFGLDRIANESLRAPLKKPAARLAQHEL